MPKQIVTTNRFLIHFLIDRKYRAGRHIVLVLFFAFLAFNMTYPTCSDILDQLDGVIFDATLILLAVYLIGLYLHLYILLPKLLLKNRYLLYIASVSLLISSIMLVSFSFDYLIDHYYRQEPGPYSFFSKDRILTVEIVGNFLMYGILIAGSSISVLLRHWLAVSKRKNELEKENLRTELERLKDRINPEFLFTMLDEAGKQTAGNPELASAILMKLSKLLRYQLYDSNREKVLLNSEISFIGNFLNLAKICYQHLSFTMTTVGNVSRCLIPPLLFIPFAIHYVKQLSTRETRLDLHFSFQSEDTGLSFSCICFTPRVGNENAGISPEPEDVRRRLDLLYQDTYTLDIREEGSLYKINLHIKL